MKYYIVKLLYGFYATIKGLVWTLTFTFYYIFFTKWNENCGLLKFLLYIKMLYYRIYNKFLLYINMLYYRFYNKFSMYLLLKWIIQI